MLLKMLTPDNQSHRKFQQNPNYQIRDIVDGDKVGIENLYKLLSLLNSSNIFERIKNFPKNGGIVESRVWNTLNRQDCKCLIAESKEEIIACYSCLLHACRYNKMILTNKDFWMSLFPESSGNLQDWISSQKLIAGSFDALVHPSWRRQKILCCLKLSMCHFLMKEGFKYMFIEIYEFERVFKNSRLFLSNICNIASMNFHYRYMRAQEVGYLKNFSIFVDDLEIIVKPHIFLSDLEESFRLLTDKLES